VRDDYESRPTGGDEAGVWQWAWADGWFRPQLDVGCHIWQNLGGCEADVTFDEEGTMHNRYTGSNPSILHFTGYVKDGVYGVYDAMMPWWNRIYPDYPGSQGGDSPMMNVVMLVKNRPRLTHQALYTLTKNTDAEFNVTIVDDGSDQETLQMLTTFARLKNVALLRNETSKGITGQASAT
jgi:hypothetical protein